MRRRPGVWPLRRRCCLVANQNSHLPGLLLGERGERNKVYLYVESSVPKLSLAEKLHDAMDDTLARRSPRGAGEERRPARSHKRAKSPTLGVNLFAAHHR